MAVHGELDIRESAVRIPVGRRTLPGILWRPDHPVGVVAFAHGSGSGRLSPRNQYVAHSLNAAHLATLLFDLLDDDEACDRRLVFDVELLAERLGVAADWLQRQPGYANLPLGYFGASTGAAAALIAAADAPDAVSAVVSRGGRPDLANAYLPYVTAPTLLIVGGDDGVVVDLNRDAAERLRCEHQLEIIPGATHLFEEPGALEEVSRLAADWFVERLGAAA